MQVQTQENNEKNLVVFHQYLWIDQFVWARALCGTRYLCFLSVDPSDRSGKILEPKIEWGQGLTTDDEKIGISQFEAVSSRQIDVSEAFSLC